MTQTNNLKATFFFFITLIGLSMMAFNLSAFAMSPEEACKKPKYTTWKEMQTERLWSPDEETLDAEQSGKVFNYYCFTRKEVNRFFDTHPKRIENANFHPILEDNPENNIFASVADDDS